MSWKRTVLLAGATLFTLACSPSGDDGTPDAGPADGGTDGGSTLLPDRPTVKASDRIGEFTAGRVASMLVGDGPVALFGLWGSPFDPAHFGGREPGNEEGNLIPSGLLVLDTRSGKTQLYTDANGLPSMPYFSGPRPLGSAAVPFRAMAWLERDRTFVAAAQSVVLKGAVDAAGAWTFTHAKVRPAGASADASVGAIAVLGTEVYAGTDAGLAVLGADLATKRWIDLSAASGALEVRELSAGRIGQTPAVAALLAAPGQPVSRLALVKAGGATELFAPGDGELFTAVLGMDGAFVVGVKEQDGRGALRVVVEREGASVLEGQVSANDLSASSFGAIVPSRIAFDAFRSQYLVGGTYDDALQGGVVRLDGTPQGAIYAFTRDVIDQRDPYRDLLPRQVDVLVADAQGRVYVGGRNRCALKWENAGFHRIEEGEGQLRVSLPWVSGVRDVTIDPHGVTWLAVRDEIPGLRCDGATLQSGVCRLKGNGSCELHTPWVNEGRRWVSAPGARAIAFGAPERREIAIATSRDGLFLRKGDVTRTHQLQYDSGLNLELTAAAWGADGSLWVGSEAAWESANDPDLDDDVVNARGPHGLGWYEVSEDGKLAARRRYVRRASDNVPNVDVAGMPSDHVHDVLPLSGNRRALVALGRERGSRTYDHIDADVSPRRIAGGIALVEDGKIHVIPAPVGTTFGDVVALAQAGDTFWALDAEAGVFRVDVQARAAERFAAPAWEAPARGLSLAVDGEGRVAVGTTKGVWVYSQAGRATQVDGAEAGFVWALRFKADGFLYAGADRGVLRVALDDASMESTPGADGPLPRDPWDLSWGCYGEIGCACERDRECLSGFTCEREGDASVCRHVDPCERNPGSAGCVCSPQAACADGLACACSIGLCTCEPAPACAADCSCEGDGMANGCPADWACDAGACRQTNACRADCTCTGEGVVGGCPSGYECQSGIAGSSCVALDTTPACLGDCTCEGEGVVDGCPSGYECQGGIMGSSCVAADATPRCASDCSCTGDGTSGGCPAGWTCQSGIAGESCVAPEPDDGLPPCADDCSCAGPGASEGCPIGMSCGSSISGPVCM